MKIIKHPWHIGHDYELYKLPYTFYVLGDTHRSWPTSQRPIPENIKFVSLNSAADCDLMLLHLDQWSVLELDKRRLFLSLRDGPPRKKIIIIHGCNILDGCSSKEMHELVQDYPVICNSATAQELWGIYNSIYVRHGISPEEWPTTNYGRNNIVVTQPRTGLHDECRNGSAVLDFETSYGLKVDWIGRNISFENFFAYRSFLGSSSVFFNPSFGSPNPRARTEAMMCGLAIVTTCAQGEDYFVNGKNGFASNDMEELFEFLFFLNRNPDAARKVGRAGQRTAREIFHSKKFLARWQAIIEAVMNDRKLCEVAATIESI